MLLTVFPLICYERTLEARPTAPKCLGAHGRTWDRLGAHGTAWARLGAVGRAWARVLLVASDWVISIDLNEMHSRVSSSYLVT